MPSFSSAVGAEGAVTARGVAQRDAEGEPGVEVAAAAENFPVARPVHHRATRDPARAEHEIGAVSEALEQARELLRLVGPVGIHLDEDVVALGQPPPEAVDVGGPQAGLARPVQNVDVVVAARPARPRLPRCRPGSRRPRPARARRARRPGRGPG